MCACIYMIENTHHDAPRVISKTHHNIHTRSVCCMCIFMYIHVYMNVCMYIYDRKHTS